MTLAKEGSVTNYLGKVWCVIATQVEKGIDKASEVNIEVAEAKLWI